MACVLIGLLTKAVRLVRCAFVNGQPPLTTLRAGAGQRRRAICGRTRGRLAGRAIFFINGRAQRYITQATCRSKCMARAILSKCGRNSMQEGYQGDTVGCA